MHSRIRFTSLTKRGAAYVAALLSAIGLVVGLSASPAAAVSPTCGNAYYPDGKVAYRACVSWTDPPGSGWIAYETLAWNPTVANNGHSDTFAPVKVNGAGGSNYLIDTLTDGETQTLTTHQWSQGANTVWFESEGSYDGKCYRVFVLPNSVSWDKVNTCSTF